MQAIMKPRLFVAAVVLGTIAAVVIVVIRKEERLDVLALDLCEESIVGKTERVFAHAFAEEIDRCGYTRENVRELWRLIILPSMVGFREVGRSSELLGPHEGFASILAQNEQGKRTTWAVAVWQTDDGPKLTISSFLLTSWWRSSNLRIWNGRNARTASLAGLRRDRATLERLGIRGLASAEPSTGSVTYRDWDTFESDLVRRLAEEDAR